MKNSASIVAEFESLVDARQPVAAEFLCVGMRILAAVRLFLRYEVTPRSSEQLERRLEVLFREMARLILQRTVNEIESAGRPESVIWEHCVFSPYARRERSMGTRVGTIRYRRWLYESEWKCFVRGIAPLDKRLGLRDTRRVRQNPKAIGNDLSWRDASVEATDHDETTDEDDQ